MFFALPRFNYSYFGSRYINAKADKPTGSNKGNTSKTSIADSFAIHTDIFDDEFIRSKCVAIDPKVLTREKAVNVLRNLNNNAVIRNVRL